MRLKASSWLYAAYTVVKFSPLLSSSSSPPPLPPSPCLSVKRVNPLEPCIVGADGRSVVTRIHPPATGSTAQAIVGYEFDQVIANEDGTESPVPVTWSYNHHYSARVVGQYAEMYRHPVDGQHDPRCV